MKGITMNTVIYDPASRINLLEYGIEVPLLDSRTGQLLNQIRKSLHQLELVEIDFPSFTTEELLLVHDHAWVDWLCNHPDKAAWLTWELRAADGSWHRYDPEKAARPLSDLIETTIRMASGTWVGAQTALEKGFSYVLGGGFHHAMAHGGAGFCLVNDIALTIAKLRQDKPQARCWVIDVDVHKGDGTAQITQHDPLTGTLSIHMADGWPLDLPEDDPTRLSSRVPSTVDIPLKPGDEGIYQEKLQEGLIQLKSALPNPDIVIVVAGSDPYEKDALPSANGINMSREQLLVRDLWLYDTFAKWQLPQTWVMAGGYGEFAWEIHCAFLEALNKREL